MHVLTDMQFPQSRRPFRYTLANQACLRWIYVFRGAGRGGRERARWWAEGGLHEEGDADPPPPLLPTRTPAGVENVVSHGLEPISADGDLTWDPGGRFRPQWQSSKREE